jgi:hypothetical protein
MAQYLQVYDLRYYDRVPCEITVHRTFQYCSLLAHDSSSRLGNSMTPNLYGLVQPLVC